MDDTQDVPNAAITPSKPRSFSDPPAALAPSPTFRETRRPSKDDQDHSYAYHASPTTPKPSSTRHLYRGLSLQVPTNNSGMPSPAQFPPYQQTQPEPPLSPHLDESDVYMQSRQQSLSASPATSIPRHSRGLDFSRASTNLHHSTIAEQQQSSPDTSPVITQKGMMIPLRKGSISSMMLDSPNFSSSTPWGPALPNEKSTVSSSVGSVNMLGSDSESSDSDDGDASMIGGDDLDDPILTTPQVHKLQNPNAAATPFALGPQTPGASASWVSGSHFSPAQASLMRTMRRTKLHKPNGRRSRKSSSSASGSGYSSMASPRAGSPPPIRSIEPAASNSTSGAGAFPWGHANAAAANATKARRESLALGTSTDAFLHQHVSSGNDSGDEASSASNNNNAPSTPNVIRRPVTRRGNLLPKTKGFARIRAALLEEAAPVDTESRRESETIRQVRERDNSVSDLDPHKHDYRPGLTASSPSLLPAVPESGHPENEDFGLELDSDNPSKGNLPTGSANFAAHANRHGAGREYWSRPSYNHPDTRTPPPPPHFLRQGSSVSSDVNMDSAFPSTFMSMNANRPRARSSASEAGDGYPNTSGMASGAAGSISDDVHLKNFKRRREDDFDIATIKRRAVSPGWSSAQNSPVLVVEKEKEGGLWGLPPSSSSSDRKENDMGNGAKNGNGNGNGVVNSNSATTASSTCSPSPSSSVTGLGLGLGLSSGVNGGGQHRNVKLGLQGMVDTNDGLMKMSIE